MHAAANLLDLENPTKGFPMAKSKKAKVAATEVETLTDINVVLDRSGSMSSIRKDVEGGYNTFIEEQRKVPGNALVSLSQFDNKYEEVYIGKDLNEVPELVLVPRGNTALFDAIGRMIHTARARHAGMTVKPTKRILVVLTDGQENASKEFTSASVLALVSEIKKEGWDVIFLGAEENSLEVAATLGFNNAVNYAASAAGSAAVFRGMSRSIGSSRLAASRGVDSSVVYNQAAYNVALNEDDDASKTAGFAVKNTSAVAPK